MLIFSLNFGELLALEATNTAKITSKAKKTFMFKTWNWNGRKSLSFLFIPQKNTEKAQQKCEFYQFVGLIFKHDDELTNLKASLMFYETLTFQLLFLFYYYPLYFTYFTKI